MTTTMQDVFGAAGEISTSGGPVTIFRLAKLADQGMTAVDRLPYSIKVLLESVLRNVDGHQVMKEDVENLARWRAKDADRGELPFKPARIVLQDFTGVPLLVDLAAMRSAMSDAGGDAKKINPLIPVDLVIDHSVQVDTFGRVDALALNAAIEFERNRERYQFLRWGQNAFDHFRVVPPETGIVHQVNLEYLAEGVIRRNIDGQTVAMPDTLVGTDSHTTMINGLGVLGWGVGGIEAEAAMLGQPMYMVTPDVIGFKLMGKLSEGATATDLVLTVTEMLRKKGVVGKFVEFYGPGLSSMSLPDRATIANMAPEYGATVGFFPVDDETLRYMRQTGRSKQTVDLVERYCKEQGLFRSADATDPEYTDTMELNLDDVEPSLAGPKRPQDRVLLSKMKSTFHDSLRAPADKRGFELSGDALKREARVKMNGDSTNITHGAVVIAAITSCTNTSNPAVMLAAGLLAKAAVEKGLKVKPYVKTSLAPGSRVVTEYLDQSGLTPYLQQLGFHTVGYGCTTCIGNSGPLPEPVAVAVKEGNLVVSSVLSGNRNFEGRVHAAVKANYLASPPLVVAYALAGTTDVDLTTEPIGKDKQGKDVFLRDIWPTQKQVKDAMSQFVTADMFQRRYSNVFNGNERWNEMTGLDGDIYPWDADNTYIQHPPFFEGFSPEPDDIHPIEGARCLVMAGDSITTDHISPAGSIPPDSPAAKYLQEHGVERKDFNSFGARRGNDRVMTRGTFGNVRMRNLLAPGTEGGYTIYLPTGEQTSIFEASQRYQKAGTPLIVLAGAEYGTGSSRDWAAKGTQLLGVKAVLATSYERIHRSNLIGMGVLPLQFKDGDTYKALGLTGHEVYSIEGLDNNLKPKQQITVKAKHQDGRETEFKMIARIDTPVEVDYYRHGGILPYVLRGMLKG